MKHLIIIAGIISSFLSSCTSNSESGKEADSAKTPTSRVGNVQYVGDSNAVAPYLFKDQENTVYLSWTEQRPGGNILKFTSFQNGVWAAPTVIAQGQDWFVNWADYPVIATHAGRNMVSHFLQKSSDVAYSYDVKVVHSADGGASWNSPYTLHDDGKNAEHGFVTILPYGENFFVTWLDGRNTTMGESMDGAMNHNGHGGAGAMTLRAAIITPSGEKLQEWELDDRVCDCCQTTAAITSEGPVVAYRNRSEEEVRDMYYVRFKDNAWTAPKPIHNDGWKIAGCPVNGPRMSGIEDHLAIGWFTAPEGNPSVNISFSTDAGETFSKPVRIDEGQAIGRVDVEMLSKSEAFISWMEGGNIVGARVSTTGEILEKYILAESSSARSAGFPQIARINDKLVLAWTDTETKKIKTAEVRFE